MKNAAFGWRAFWLAAFASLILIAFPRGNDEYGWPIRAVNLIPYKLGALSLSPPELGTGRPVRETRAYRCTICGTQMTLQEGELTPACPQCGESEFDVADPNRPGPVRRELLRQMPAILASSRSGAWREPGAWGWRSFHAPAGTIACNVFVITGELLFVLVVTWLALRYAARPPRGHCRSCGYDLTGNVTGRCPECGCAVVSTPATDRGHP